jgi:hypothetical protein
MGGNADPERIPISTLVVSYHRPVSETIIRPNWTTPGQEQVRQQHVTCKQWAEEACPQPTRAQEITAQLDLEW